MKIVYKIHKESLLLARKTIYGIFSTLNILPSTLNMLPSTLDPWRKLRLPAEIFGF